MLSMRGRVGAFRVDWIRVEAWDIAIVSIEGHRHRHSPSIGIRETGIDGLDVLEMRDAKLEFSSFSGPQPCRSRAYKL